MAYFCILRLSSIKHRGIKNTRHTFATHILKDNTVTINELSGLLGHAKVSTTLSFYASVINGNNIEVKKKLNSFCYHVAPLTPYGHH